MDVGDKDVDPLPGSKKSESTFSGGRFKDVPAGI
jgi:hypothetical protein